MTDEALERIEGKLRLARERGARPFGVESHELRVSPPLSPDEIEAAEARLGVRFPEEYRGFIARIGDGGAGPAFGVFSLAAALRQSRLDLDPTLLRTAFPHTARYNPDKDPEVIAFWRSMDGENATDAEIELYLVRERRGALVLCDEGCGYLHFLVVTGPACGTMWIDARGSDGGFVPLGVTFLQWYERWLDHLLAGGRGTWWLDAPPAAEAPASTAGA